MNDIVVFTSKKYRSTDFNKKSLEGLLLDVFNNTNIEVVLIVTEDYLGTVKEVRGFDITKEVTWHSDSGVEFIEGNRKMFVGIATRPRGLKWYGKRPSLCATYKQELNDVLVYRAIPAILTVEE